MKECSFCGESIQNTAKKCRFCGEWLENNFPTTQSETDHNKEVKVDTKEEIDSKKKKKIFLKQNIGMIIGGLALFSGLGSIGNGDGNGIDIAMFGLLLLIFSWCYKSSKKRMLGMQKKKKLMVSLEIVLIIISSIILFSQDNLADHIYTNPIPLAVFILGIISYIYINFIRKIIQN